VESSRIEGDGVPCTDARNCLPGFMCVDTMGSGTVCRQICRLDAMDCASDKVCEKLVRPDYKTFGACLPKI
jgi:hypothetical protein